MTKLVKKVREGIAALFVGTAPAGSTYGKTVRGIFRRELRALRRRERGVE
ncbi:MAG: hypothetical protein ACK4SY_10120 [Pyrobaculum sp.]